jgi:zinc protease
MMDHLKAYTLSTSTRSAAAAEIAGIVEAEWKKMRDEPVTDRELADAKAYLIGSLPLSLSSTENIAGILLGLRLDGLPMDYLDARTEKINAVTAADVQRVAQRMLTPGKLTVVTVGGYPEKLTPTTTLESLPHVD